MKMNFEELYDRYFKDVYYFIYAMSKNSHIAEEITQETFYRALKESRNFRGECSGKTWLCKIAKNLYLSYLRKNKKIADEPMEEEADSTDVELFCIQKSEVLSIYKILHHLEEPYKEVFTLRTLGELSYKEIADIFEKQENWARVTYYRARMKIVEYLESEKGEVGK